MSLMETVCPRCQGSLIWYARARRAWCLTCHATVIIILPPRRRLLKRKVKPSYHRGLIIKPKPIEKVYEKMWFNGKLIFEGEVDPREPVIPIEYTVVRKKV